VDETTKARCSTCERKRRGCVTIPVGAMAHLVTLCPSCFTAYTRAERPKGAGSAKQLRPSDVKDRRDTVKRRSIEAEGVTSLSSAQAAMDLGDNLYVRSEVRARDKR
jgi:hypothetical protein